MCKVRFELGPILSGSSASQNFQNVQQVLPLGVVKISALYDEDCCGVLVFLLKCVLKEAGLCRSLVGPL